MTVPSEGDELNVTSLGKNSKLLDKEIKSVELLGGKGKLEWEQGEDGLKIVYPGSDKIHSVAGFKVEFK